MSSNMGMEKGKRRRESADESSRVHDARYHKLKYLSTSFIVLVFSRWPSFVRKISQEEENKGVEFAGAVYNAGLLGDRKSKKE